MGRAKSGFTNLLMSHKQIEDLDERVWDVADSNDSITGTLGKRCHTDKRRTRSLMTIIARTLRRDSFVCELGGGTGILGFASSFAGARHVAVVEISQDLVDCMKETALALGYRRVEDYLFEKDDGRTVEIHKGDALEFDPTVTNPGQKLDALIVEMVGTTLGEERVVPAYQNIRQYTSAKAQCYPAAAELKVSVGENRDAYTSQPVVYRMVDFMKEEATGVDTTVRIPVNNCFRARTIYLNFDTALLFPGGLRTERFDRLCPTWDIDFINHGDLPQGWINYGDIVNVRIKYEYAKSRNDIQAEFLGIERFSD